MRRRITTAIIGVTTFVLLVLGVPLAIVVQRSMIDSEVVRLQATIAHLLTEIKLPVNPTELDTLQHELDAPPPFGIYDKTGRRVYGVGPETADAAVRDAELGSTSSRTSGAIIVATPLTDRSENVLIVVRVSRSLAGPHSRARRSWLIMAGAGAVALAIAWLLARRLAGRLTRPVADLAASAVRLGSGGAVADHPPSGMAEIDLLGEALTESSSRINDAIGRERRFSADVSHQLRTPLAGLRLRLERVEHGDDASALSSASLADLGRLEQTVSHLLAFARDATPTTESSPIDHVATTAVRRWSERCESHHRTIVAEPNCSAVVQASTASIDQILDVLIDNALDHGTGSIRVVTRSVAGGAAIDVSDEGSSADSGTDEELFRRGHGSNNGIGLALARSIADAEGGRLIIARREPTTFSLLLLTSVGD